MKSALILAFITITFSLAAQKSYIPSVKTYTTEDGLSSNEVNAIHKDARGFLWIGTEYGLNRFDGQTFQVFTKENLPGLPFNTIHEIAEDGDNNLWILKTHDKYNHEYTKSDLVLLNIYSGEVTVCEDYFGEAFPFEDEHITFFQQLDDQSIFIHSEKDKKAFIYHHETGFQPFPVPEKTDIIREVFRQNDGGILMTGFGKSLGPSRQFYQLNTLGDIIAHGNRGFDLLVTEDNAPLVLHIDGFWNLSLRNHLKRPIEYGNNNQEGPKTISQSAYNVNEQLIWLRTMEHFKVLNKDNEVVYRLPYHLNKKEVKAVTIWFDNDKTWIADGENGIQVITLQANHFATFQPFQNNESNSLRGLLQDRTGKTWFSTIHQMGFKDTNGTINILGKPIHFSRFLEDKSGNIWFGCYQKLNKYDNRTGQLTTYPDSILSFFWSLYEADNGEIWFDLGSDIIAFDDQTQSFRNVIAFDKSTRDDFNIYDIQKRDYKSIWVSSSHGLFLISPEGELLATFNQDQETKNYLPAMNFHHLHQDNNGVIWMATGDGGLIKCQVSDDNYEIIEYQNFTMSEGLSSDALHAVYEDEYGYLWLSSDNGLMQFDKETEQITKYFKKDGVADSEFNRISHCQGNQKETLYFGGLNGWTTFDPENYADNRDKVRLPSLTINNLQQFSAKKGQFEDLTAAVLASKTITLKPSDRFFNIQMALLDFYNAKNSTFSHRVTGVYDWQSTKNPDINISGLPYGSHTLEITAQNGNRQQAGNILTFTVQVLRPFYLQWWFVVLILVAFAFSVFYYFKWRTRQLLIAKETEQLRHIDKMKSHFFANISHELRTPITLILAPVTHLMKNFGHQSAIEIEYQLQNIRNNAKSLLRLVNEVLDLSKLEANKLELFLSPTQIPRFIERVAMTFESAAKTKGIDYQFVSFLQKDIYVLFDKSKLEKIINNLLSNALKFTPKKGSIQVITGQSNDQLIIRVKDSGRGIPEEDIPHIFDRYFQSKNKNQAIEGGTGIGLALTKEVVELMKGSISVQSALDEGTQFEISLPIKPATDEAFLLMEEDREKPYSLNIDNLINPDLTPSKEKDTILLVEDNPSLQQFIQSILAPHYNVTITNNGLEALEWLSGCQLPITDHLILSDVMMPEMDGFTLLERIKNDDDFCSIPFILLTARADMKDKIHALRIGVDDYMTKPFEVEELLLRIQKLMTNAKNRTIEEKSESPQTGVLTPSSGSGKSEDSISKDSSSGIEKTQPSTTELEWLKKVEAIALREIRNRSYSTEDLAQELLISHRQLFRKIKKITGLPPKKYMNTIRLQHAKYILETEDVYTLSEVCHAIGISNTTQFANAYKAEFGKRPYELLRERN